MNTPYRLFFVCVLATGLYYLYQSHSQKELPATFPIPEPPLAMQTHDLPAPFLSNSEIEKIRISTRDSDPSVRWAAIELLYRLHDPEALKTLEEALSIDTESDVRRNALSLLKSSRRPGVIKDLVHALKDSEKEIRLAALIALGEMGDPKAIPYIVESAKDVEPEIRLQAIHALGTIQEKRLAQYRQQQQMLQQTYDKQLQSIKMRNQLRKGTKSFLDKTKDFHP